MKLHLDKNTFKDAILATSQHFGIREVFIEKDYWVVYGLKNLSLSQLKEDVVFKGGTSLSKAWKLIDRFSEDIDLAVLEKERNGNQIKTLIKNVEKVVAGNLKEVEIKGQSQKYSKIRRTYYEYNKVVEGDFAQAQDKLLIETNCFTLPIPHKEQSIQTYIADFLIETGNSGIIPQFELEPINIYVLHYERTFLEKTLALVKRSYSENFASGLQDKIRHIYDLHMILKKTDIAGKFNEENFFKLMVSVQKDEQKMGEGEWTKSLGEACLFCDTEATWKLLDGTYKEKFKPMVFKDFPESKEIVSSIQSISELLYNFDKWKESLSQP